jgi:hypothetical protein
LVALVFQTLESPAVTVVTSILKLTSSSGDLEGVGEVGLARRPLLTLVGALEAEGLQIRLQAGTGDLSMSVCSGSTSAASPG